MKYFLLCILLVFMRAEIAKGRAKHQCENKVLNYCDEFFNKLYSDDAGERCRYVTRIMQCVNANIRDCSNLEEKDAETIRADIREFTELKAPDCELGNNLNLEQKIDDMQLGCEDKIEIACGKLLEVLYSNVSRAHCSDVWIANWCVNETSKECDIEEEAEMMREDFKVSIDSIYPDCDPRNEDDVENGRAKHRYESKILNNCDKFFDKLHSADIRKHCEYVIKVRQCVNDTISDCNNLEEKDAELIRADIKEFKKMKAADCEL